MLQGIALISFMLQMMQSAPHSPAAAKLEKSLAAAVKDFKGTIGIAAKNLITGEEIGLNRDTRFPTASTIKVAVMMEVYEQEAANTLRLDTPITLHESDKVGGSGVLSGLHDGLTLTVADLVQLMIVLSDNTATNLLITRLGTSKINARLSAYGLQDTRLFRPTFRDGHADVHPELEREFGLGMTTPRDMTKLLALIADGKAVSPDASAAMLATLRRQQDRAMIPRLLPAVNGLEVGNKTGTDAEKRPAADGTRRHVRGDVAIVSAPGVRYVVAILTREVDDTRWGIENDAMTTGARVSRIIYDYFTGQ